MVEKNKKIFLNRLKTRMIAITFYFLFVFGVFCLSFYLDLFQALFV